MVIAGLLDSNKHEDKWYYASETSSEVHRFIMHSDLDNISPHFPWYDQNTSIHFNLEHLDVIYTPSHHLLRSYMTEHNNYHSWVTQTA